MSWAIILDCNSNWCIVVIKDIEADAIRNKRAKLSFSPQTLTAKCWWRSLNWRWDVFEKFLSMINPLRRRFVAILTWNFSLRVNWSQVTFNHLVLNFLTRLKQYPNQAISSRNDNNKIQHYVPRVNWVGSTNSHRKEIWLKYS